MKKKLNAKVSEISGVDVQTLSLEEVIEQVILPKILRIGGQDTRGWRIPDTFMELMAEFGDYIYHQNPKIGSILLEIALQRLSCGAVLHEPTSYLDALPTEYKKYSAKCDEYGVMSDACWLFLTKRINTCLYCPETRVHAKKILLGLLDSLDEKINDNGTYMFGGINFQISPKEGYKWDHERAMNLLTFEELYDFFATPERHSRYRSWFKSNWKKINQKNFFKKTETKGFFKKRKLKKAILA